MLIGCISRLIYQSGYSACVMTKKWMPVDSNAQYISNQWWVMIWLVIRVWSIVVKDWERNNGSQHNWITIVHDGEDAPPTGWLCSRRIPPMRSSGSHHGAPKASKVWSLLSEGNSNALMTHRGRKVRASGGLYLGKTRNCNPGPSTTAFEPTASTAMFLEHSTNQLIESIMVNPSPINVVFRCWTQPINIEDND